MSKITTTLGYGQTSTVEYDFFTRIMKGEFWDDEEVRYDRTNNRANAFEYCGVAPAGSSPLDPVWMCVRRCYDSQGKPYRDQFRKSISWSARTEGWM